MDEADQAIIYFSPNTVEHKQLDPISPEEIRKAFDTDHLEIYTDAEALQSYLEKTNWNNSVLLFMSSGNYNGIDLQELSDRILQ